MNRYEYIFTWKIENFSHCLQRTGEMIESPPFIAEDLSRCKWNLMVYPKGERNSNFMSCYLKIKEHDHIVEVIAIDFTIEILGRSDEVVHSYSVKSAKFEKWGNRSSWGWSSFIPLDKLTDEIKYLCDGTLTLRCCMSGKAKKSTNSAIGCAARTLIGVDKGSFKWDVKIPHFLPLSESVIFTVPGVFQYEISLNAPTEHTEIALRCLDVVSTLPRSMTFKATFLNEKGIEVSSKKESYFFQPVIGGIWKFPITVSKKLLEATKNGVKWWEFSLVFEVSVSNGSMISKIERSSYCSAVQIAIEGTTTKETALQNNFRDIFLSKQHSDVQLRVDNEVFLAHKTILAARSPVFSAMFGQDMSENESGIVDIVDVDGKTLHLFLEYMYTDSVSEIEYDTAKVLFLVADKYQVGSLKEKCSSILVSSLSEKNVCDIIGIADLVNEELLKKSAINFIKAKASRILSSQDWLNWIKEHNNLASEVLCEISLHFVPSSKGVGD